MANFAVLIAVSFYLLATANCHPCGPEESNTQFPYMEITPSDYSKKFVAKADGPNEVQFEESGGEVEIRCWSKSSFLMEFHGHLTNREAIVDQIEIKEPLQGHRCYSANLRILQLSRSTGEYSCRSLDEEMEAGHDMAGGNMTSAYIYIRPNNTKYLLHRHTSQPIQVERLWDSETLIIPCAVSDPDAEITLTRRPKDSEAAVPWTEVQDKRFDPKKGWILPATKDAEEFVYKCSSKSDKDTVEAELVLKRNFTVDPDLQKVTYQPSSSVNFSCSAGIPIKIEASDAEIVPLGVPMEQQKSGGPGGNQVIYQVTRTLSIGYSIANMEVTCNAVNGNDSEPLHIWRILPPLTARSQNKDTSLKINFQLDRTSNSILTYPCNNLLECGVRQCQIYDSNCQSKPTYVSSKPHNTASGGELMELVRPGKPPVVEMLFKSLKDNNYYLTWRRTSAKDVLQVTLKPSDTSVEPSSVSHFECSASAMVLAAPIRWYLNVPELNDTIPIPVENITMTYGSTKGIIKSEARITMPSNADLQNASVRCEAPIWSPQQFSIPMNGAIHMDLFLNTSMMMTSKPIVLETTMKPIVLETTMKPNVHETTMKPNVHETTMKPTVDQEATTAKNPKSTSDMYFEMRERPSSEATTMKSSGHDHQNHKNHEKQSRNTTANAISNSKPTTITVVAIALVLELFF